MRHDERARNKHPLVLMVDNNPTNLELLTIYLEDEGYVVASASSGSEALDSVAKAPPDLIFLDAMMPGMDGFTVCRRLKSMKETRMIPVVIVTALFGVEDRVRGIEAGADDFLSKPVNRHEILTRARSLLKMKRYVDELEGAKRANARLYENARTAQAQLQVWNEELEAKVAERTKQAEQHRKDLSKRVLAAQEEERKRIARELHDETAQSLSTLLINIDLLELQAPPPDLRLRAGLEGLRNLTQHTLDETRALAHDLRPPILDDVGLVAALQWFAKGWSESFHLKVDVVAEACPHDRLPPETEVVLFRIAQEALNNAGKHARGGRQVWVVLTFPDGSANLVVKDDGQGFDGGQTAGPSRQGGGLGLFGMKERAELAGGTLEINSSAAQGTCVTTILPLYGTGDDLEAA